jgi:uncharacterized membrane protein YtjA (UPF0391 family)
MLRWALAFLIIALGAAAFGFGGATGMFGTLARAVFYLFLFLSVDTLAGRVAGRPDRR